MKRKRSLGFAFMNFPRTETAVAFMERWQGYLIPQSSKPIDVRWAEVQGFVNDPSIFEH